LSIQPDVRGHDRPTSHGFAEQVWRARARRLTTLTLAKLGRGGETAGSMIKSKRPGPSQLQLAEQHLRAGSVALVTIDIGANEVESCQRGTGFDPGCVQRGLASLRASLPTIIGRLRAAGGADLRIVGVNYYNSFLGRWVRGADGRRVARASVTVERAINSTLAQVYARAQVPVADVESRFKTRALGRYVATRSYGRVPLAVANTCRWTWACSARYDDHTNTAGYTVIARGVLGKL
jgi:lysophospholipase L1-like esterase